MSFEPSSLAGGRPGSTRIAFRIARRMAGQSRGRSALIALLVAIPVLGMVGITTVTASNVATPAEHVALELGSTEARVVIAAAPDPQFTQDPINDRFSGHSDQVIRADAAQSIEPTPVTAASLFPAGTHLLSIRKTNVVAETKDGLGSFNAVQGQPWDPAFAGKYDVTSGSAPTNGGEIMVTAAALDRLGAQIGSTAVMTAPRAASFTIVGTIRYAYFDDSIVAFYGMPGAFDGIMPDDADLMTEWYLPDTPLTWSQIGELNPRGATVLSRTVLLDPPPAGSSPFDSSFSRDFENLFIALLGGFALFEVALLAGAAFTVGARTQQRTLATLASVGGDKRMLFRVMSFGGVILGALGAALGTLLGLAGAWIFMQISANGSAARYPGFHLDLVSLLVIAIFAVLAGWCAAAVPARAAGRIDVLAALRGAQRPPRATRRRPAAGLVLLAIGAVMAVTGGLIELAAYVPTYRQGLATLGIWLIVGGPVIMQIGAVFVAPLILRWAARVASRVGPAARLATRDVARNPGRSVPAIAAIMSCVFVATFAMSLVATFQLNSTKNYVFGAPLDTAWVSLNTSVDEPPYGYELQTSGLEVVAAVDSSFPSAQARLLSSAEDPPMGFGETDAERSGNAAAEPTFALPRLDPGAVCPSDASRPGSNPEAENRTDTRCPTPYYLDTFTMSSMNDHIWVGDLADFAAILGEPVSTESRATLAAGGAVATYAQYVVNDSVQIDWITELNSTLKPARSLTLAASVQEPEHPLPYAVFMLTATADASNLAYRPSMVVSSIGAAPTQAEFDHAQGALAAISPKFSLISESGPQTYGASWTWALLALTTIIALVTASITIGLARADGHRDNAVLTSLGASPRVRRAFGFWQAVVIVGLGSIIGVLLGLVPSLALSLTRDTAGHSLLPFTPPWLQLALIVVALPAVVAVGGALTTGGNRTRFSNRAAFD
ncbi:FtsX-like permease family protein [Cryobacterium sp. Y82]|uniref:FtsX-like permease family protein n=1 Tax=Cryobacterium sp. Y82 TaxID=2045017 RepID=UPI000CE313B3|nr:FtsX-like permease family protein [Cryobacterium sp. Y82]